MNIQERLLAQGTWKEVVRKCAWLLGSIAFISAVFYRKKKYSE
jgi:hypothetical protein